jgi:hypothetical protein
MRKTLTRTQIWGMPILLGLLSVIGLIAALAFDRAGDIISWILLAMPLIIILQSSALPHQDR